jgi:lipopolysaccharide export system ATP-binding protein
VLQARALTKSYGRRVVVHHVNLEIQTGEVVGLLGPNGAGKTTTFYMVVGLARPDSGQVFLGGRHHCPAHVPKRARAGIGYHLRGQRLPQSSPSRTSWRILGHGPDAGDESAGRELLDELGSCPGQGRPIALRRRAPAPRDLPRHLACLHAARRRPFAGIDPIAVVDIQNLVVHEGPW